MHELWFIRDSDGHCMRQCPHLEWITKCCRFTCRRFDRMLSLDFPAGEPYATARCLQGWTLTVDEKRRILADTLCVIRNGGSDAQIWMEERSCRHK